MNNDPREELDRSFVAGCMFGLILALAMCGVYYLIYLIRSI